MKRPVSEVVAVFVSMFIAAGIAGVRWRYESAMPDLVPTDAQGPIFVLHSVVVCLLTFAACFLLLCGAWLLFTSGKKHRVNGVLALCAFLFIAGCTGNTLREHAEAKQALLDAAAPETAPERLRELIGFRSGFGYEVDNRIAQHPNATEEILRELSRSAHNQSGTLLILARNPNTPQDVILVLAENPNKWLQDALKEREKR